MKRSSVRTVTIEMPSSRKGGRTNATSTVPSLRPAAAWWRPALESTSSTSGCRPANRRIVSPTSGTVDVLGLPAGSPTLRPRVGRHARERVGYVTQAPSVYGDLTVLENLRYFAAIAGAGPARVAEVLDAVGLAEHAAQLTASLSGGERARVSLASALLGRPELLVLDEPTVGLDPVLRAELWRLFHALAGDGATLLVSSHVMDEAAECDRLLLMRDGALLEQTTPQLLRERTGEHDLGRAFLAVIQAATR